MGDPPHQSGDWEPYVYARIYFLHKMLNLKGNLLNRAFSWTAENLLHKIYITLLLNTLWLAPSFIVTILSLVPPDVAAILGVHHHPVRIPKKATGWKRLATPEVCHLELLRGRADKNVRDWSLTPALSHTFCNSIALEPYLRHFQTMKNKPGFFLILFVFTNLSLVPVAPYIW